MESTEVGISQFFSTYQNDLKKSLDAALDYTSLLKTLTVTSDDTDLISAAYKLSKYQLDNQNIQFPNKFSAEDIYLVFMKRLLELNGIKNKFDIQSINKIEQLKAYFLLLKEDSFYFVKSTKDTDTYFFTNSDAYLPLFCLNLRTKEIFFNSNALVRYFIVEKEAEEPENIKGITQTLIKFASLLKEKFGFKVDFNILDSTNGEFYAFAAGDLEEPIMDELFVKAAENGFMLTSGENNEAILNLNDDIQLIVLNQNNANHPKWGALIRDKNQKESWFDLLLDYSFIREWYLKNQKPLEILSNSLIFE
ncbi:hypothetical protein [Lentilactobacillus laojiaonis]|uniref:hypothetical protein n=1 Tax=Lentilactobacillus laojiaonis TaxID=2883998 RepID=UPI001D09DB2D|nr:hypothetical protein [Lentilactobacillus laojiaonis]UDM32627.1 hypothetical protein LHL71_02675 [Lentilactobacillus laojiaonis]